MKVVLPTGERVYQTVKAELLAGTYGPGERIEAVALAQRHMTSITPIRAALHRLVGERLIGAQAGEGFQAPIATEAGLRDLFAWNGHIVLLAWRLAANGPQQRDLSPSATDLASDPAHQTSTATAELFAAMGARSGNEQCAAAVNQLNDRLHAARRLERELITDLDEEFRSLARTIGAGRQSEIRHVITGYHRRRIRLAADLVRLMHRRPR